MQPPEDPGIEGSKDGNSDKGISPDQYTDSAASQPVETPSIGDGIASILGQPLPESGQAQSQPAQPHGKQCDPDQAQSHSGKASGEQSDPGQASNPIDALDHGSTNDGQGIASSVVTVASIVSLINSPSETGATDPLPTPLAMVGGHKISVGDPIHPGVDIDGIPLMQAIQLCSLVHPSP